MIICCELMLIIVNYAINPSFYVFLFRDGAICEQIC